MTMITRAREQTATAKVATSHDFKVPTKKRYDENLHYEVVDTTYRPDPVGGDCDQHGAFWPLFLIDGEPRCPACLLPRVVAGDAELTDPETAQADLQSLCRRARLGMTAPTRIYQAVITAHWDRVRAELRANALAALGLEEGDDYINGGMPRLLTATEVAAVFGRSDKWVYSRPSGLPAPVRVGGSLYWRADAVARLLGVFNPPKERQR